MHAVASLQPPQGPVGRRDQDHLQAAQQGARLQRPVSPPPPLLFACIGVHFRKGPRLAPPRRLTAGQMLRALTALLLVVVALATAAPLASTSDGAGAEIACTTLPGGLRALCNGTVYYLTNVTGPGGVQ